MYFIVVALLLDPPAPSNSAVAIAKRAKLEICTAYSRDLWLLSLVGRTEKTSKQSLCKAHQ